MSLCASLFVLLVLSFTARAEKWDAIHPIGEENLGTLAIHEPNWSSPEERHVFPYVMMYRTTALKAEFPTRFLAGTGMLTVNSPELNSPLTITDIDVEKKKQKDIYLSGIVLHWDRAENNPLEVDFGLKPSLSVTTGGKLLNRNSEAWSGGSPRGLVIVPGTYKFSFNLSVLDPIEKTVTAREVTRLDLTPPDRRARIAIHMPERIYPSPTPVGCELVDRIFLVQRSSSAEKGIWTPHPYDVKYKQVSSSSTAFQILSYLDVDTSKDVTYRTFPYPDTEKEARYELIVSNLLVPLKLSPGRTVDLNVKRIDVDDVLVTKESGDKVYVKGSYTVSRKNLVTAAWEPVRPVAASGSDCSGYAKLGRMNYPTKSGIDVIPGIYRVVVSYTTEEGAKTQEYEMDLSH